MDQLKAALAKEDKPPAVLFLDLDRFKIINDTLGHAAGDRFLVAVAERLSESVDGNGILARFAGDEFTGAVEDGEEASVPCRLAEQILTNLNRPLTIDGHEVWPNASIGIALACVPKPSADELLSRADVALYQAKLRGRGRYVLLMPNSPVPSARRRRRASSAPWATGSWEWPAARRRSGRTSTANPSPSALTSPPCSSAPSLSCPTSHGCSGRRALAAAPFSWRSPRPRSWRTRRRPSGTWRS